MTPYAYRIMKPHICATCGSNFMSGHPNARYCTLKCQRKSTLHRRRERDEVIEIDNRFHMIIKDPTTAQLDSAAKDILLDMTNNKPIKVFGNVPYWSPPKGVDLVDQHEDVPTFIMLHPEMIDKLLQPTSPPKLTVEIEKPKRSQFRVKQILEDNI